MTQNANTQALSDAGVSIWLDDLNRPMVTGDELSKLVETNNVVGVTSNPTIFATALSDGSAYNEQVAELAAAGQGVDEAVFAITTKDVMAACDILHPVYDATNGEDGRVSIEVDPRMARDTEGTVTMAKQLWETIGRENCMIKIPATVEGLPAISAVLAEGISVNVTLIFSLDRYRGVMNAFLTGLEQARENGKDLSKIRSVASFFVSRVDTEFDARLDAVGTDEAKALKSKAGIANARLAYQAFEEVFSTPRWQTLADDGAHVQRPLWASTGVKDPSLPDTLYVTELAAPNTVNTMPPKTLAALADHGTVEGDRISGTYDEAKATMDALEHAGVSYADVVDKLETEGLDKFEKSWEELLGSVRSELEKAGENK